ncbi:hypothetical protein J2Z26_002387 [Bacillus luteolus]|nr:hypothetical protein [Cytobacillus luteolus]
MLNEKQKQLFHALKFIKDALRYFIKQVRIRV